MPRQKSTHVDDPRAVGRRLREARERAGLSQRRLAFPGCSPAYISRIEAGDRIPSLQLLRELGRRLGVTEDYLATGTDRAVPAPRLLEAELALRLDELDRAEELYERALAAAVTPRARADALEGLGHLALRRGDPRRAIGRFEAALAAVGDEPWARPALAESLGRAYALVGALRPAIRVFEHCLEAYEERGDELRSVRFACLLGYALVDAGDFERAERVVSRALSAGSSIADPFTRARLYWSRYRLLIESSRPDEASRYAYMALAVLEATEDEHHIAIAHQGIASVELDRGDAAEALDHLRRGWHLLDRSGSPIEKAQFRIEEARALARLGRREEAAALAMEIAGRIVDADPVDAGRTYALLADVVAELGERERARELYELAAEFLARTGPNRFLAETYRKLAELHELEGRREVADELARRAVGVREAASGAAAG